MFECASRVTDFADPTEDAAAFLEELDGFRVFAASTDAAAFGCARRGGLRHVVDSVNSRSRELWTIGN
jgi:hypothetical protein